jgi:hypothetical protein
MAVAQSDSANVSMAPDESTFGASFNTPDMVPDGIMWRINPLL